MNRKCLYNLILPSVLLVTGGFTGCSGGKRLSILVTRPAEINLRGFDKIAIGSVALISGAILAYDYDEEETWEDVTQKDKKTSRRKYDRKGTAHVKVQLRIVDLRTSRILGSRNFSERETIKTSGKTSSDARIDNADRRRLFAACRAGIVRSLVRMIVPYTERVYVSFETDKEMPELERGFRLVDAGNWDAALNIFQESTQTYSNSTEVHKAYFNLGLSDMYTDRFNQARTALQEAYARKSSGKYRNAILELDGRVEEKRRLEEQNRADPDAEEDETETTGVKEKLNPADAE